MIFWWKPLFNSLYPMVSSSAKEVFIQGIIRDGKTFCSGDWAERLADLQVVEACLLPDLPKA